jgi:hypothetical protein
MATPTAATPDRTRPDHGVSLVALVVVVAVLGGMAAIVVSKLGASSGLNPEQLPSVTLPVSHTPATTSGKKPIASGSAGISDISAAVAAACRADYEAATEAAAEYDALNGRAPATLAQLESFLKDPLTSASFTISVDPQIPGQLEVAAPGHPAEPGSANCAYAR